MPRPRFYSTIVYCEAHQIPSFLLKIHCQSPYTSSHTSDEFEQSPCHIQILDAASAQEKGYVSAKATTKENF